MVDAARGVDETRGRFAFVADDVELLLVVVAAGGLLAGVAVVVEDVSSAEAAAAAAVRFTAVELARGAGDGLAAEAGFGSGFGFRTGVAFFGVANDELLLMFVALSFSSEADSLLRSLSNSSLGSGESPLLSKRLLYLSGFTM